VDNSTIHSQLKANNSFIYLWKTTAERDAVVPPSGHNVYNMGSDSANIIWHKWSYWRF
jgi:hypothetical protein